MSTWLRRCAILMLLVGRSGAAQEPSRYMGGAVELVEAPNGAIVNAEILEVNSRIMYTEPTVEEVVDGVWSIGGYSIANATVIETDEGLIVYDTGDTREEAEHLREAIAGISDKPIKVIIYSHSHYALGGGALVDDPSDVMVIGHPRLNQTVEASLRGGGSPSAIPEVGPAMTSRLMVQFNNFLPDEGPDAALAGRLELGKPIAFLPANRTVENEETLDLLGLEVQFFTEFTSDDFNLTVWVPEKGVVMNNFFWPGTPNLYTLRGGVYRDPMIWRDGLKVIRDLQPEVLLSTHTRPVVGREEVLARLTGYMDQITLTFDQTLRGILQGLGPDGLRDFVRVPTYLKEIPENAQTYGETVHFPEAIYQYVIGWFDGDVTQLFKVSPTEEADRLVELMGGPADVMSAARSAFERGEYAWGAQLVQYLYLLDPMDPDVRQLKADLLRQMAYRTTGSIARAFLMSDALALEGKVTIPLLVLPTPEIVAESPDVFVNYLRVRIDPEESGETDMVLGFRFTDKEDRFVALHLRRGVAEFIPDPDTYYREPDAVLRMNSETWSALYLSTLDLTEAIEAGRVQIDIGDPVEVTRAFAVFDRFDPTRNHKIPPMGS